jgi:hypothetical protein
MYLCSENEQVRAAITEAFKQYTDKVGATLEEEFDAYHHWAKIEVPLDAAEKELMQVWCSSLSSSQCHLATLELMQVWCSFLSSSQYP